MVEISEEEQRVWKYLVAHRLAGADEIALNCDVPLSLAESCLARVGTPREVFELELTPLEEPAPVPAVWPEEGRKDDGGKAPYHLLAPEFLDATAQVLKFGAEKYSERNWERGMDWSRPFSAMMRHMWAWWRGEKADPETGMSHLWHASCCVMFLLAYEARDAGTDNRPKQ